MSQPTLEPGSAQELLDRLRDDHDFAADVQRRANDPSALQTFLADQGFHLADDELAEAFLARYGDRLSPEQLDAVSGGLLLLLGPAIVMLIGVVMAASGIGLVTDRVANELRP